MFKIGAVVFGPLCRCSYELIYFIIIFRSSNAEKMSVIARTRNAVLLDHLSFLNGLPYKSNCDHESYEIDPKMFDLRVPFVMDSAVDNRVRGNLKKRKGIASCSDNSEDIVSLLENELKELVSIGKNCNHFLLGPPSQYEYLENNKGSRKIINDLKPAIDAIQCSLLSSPPIFKKVDEAMMFSLQDRSFLLPKNCAFHLGKLGDSVDLLLNSKQKYDVLVLDPPWTNKHVKRRKGYNMIANDELLRELCPLEGILSASCLVFVWVTNKQTHKDFVLKELFKVWNVEFIAEWIWLKVTKYGEPVHPLYSSHKKPFERIIVGKSKDNMCRPDGLDKGTHIPEKLTIVSVPSSVHSHKPPLEEVMNLFVDKGKFVNRLELFARSLLPGWMSCGNQAVLLQDKQLFMSVCEK